MTIFAASVFDATVIVDDHELIKGRGAAEGWAAKLAKELETEVTVRKVGAGWALCAQLDGAEVLWGVLGQRLARIN